MNLKNTKVDSRRRLARITLIALLIALSIAFGAAQNVTENLIADNVMGVDERS